MLGNIIVDRGNLSNTTNTRSFPLLNIMRNEQQLCI